MRLILYFILIILKKTSHKNIIQFKVVTFHFLEKIYISIPWIILKDLKIRYPRVDYNI